jgi:hypothetical protein
MRLFLNEQERARLDAFETLNERVDNLIDALHVLKTLANGCQKHPSYRGLRTPTCDCLQCQAIHQAAVQVKGTSYDPLVRPRKKRESKKEQVIA